MRQISKWNSTVATVAAGENFEGGSENVKDFQQSNITVESSQDATLEVFQSVDKETWVKTDEFEIAANELEKHIVNNNFEYFKLKFTNTSGSSASVTISTIFGEFAAIKSTFNGEINPDDDVTNVRALLIYKDGSEFKNLSTDEPLPITSADIGSKADAAASSDTGSFSIIAFIKRALQNWTSLLALLPTLTNRNIYSTVNASTTPLNAGQAFTGTAEEIFYPSIAIACFTDQDGQLQIQFSDNGTNWDSTLTYKLTAGENEVHRNNCYRRYYRVIFTNTSASNQAYFRLSSMQAFYGLGNQSLNSTVQQDADAILVRSIPEDIDIAAGKFSGISRVYKNGLNPDIDTGSVPEDIGGEGAVYSGFATAAQAVRVVSTSVNDTSAGTGARTISVTGLDANYNILSETVTLNGTTPVATVNSFIRVHTARIVTAGSGGVNAGTITISQNVTTTNIFAVMQPSKNQTNESAYTIPAGYTGYLTDIFGFIRGTSGQCDGAMWIRNFGEVFRERRPFSFSANTRFSDKDGILILPEKSDVVMRITFASANNLVVSGGYTITLVKN